MAVTVKQEVVSNGLYVGVLNLDGGSVGELEVGHLKYVTVQVVRTGSTDTIAVTGSNSSTFVPVTSTTQNAGSDTALTAVSSGVHTITQRTRYIRFTPSGSTDSFVITVTGATR